MEAAPSWLYVMFWQYEVCAPDVNHSRLSPVSALEVQLSDSSPWPLFVSLLFLFLNLLASQFPSLKIRSFANFALLPSRSHQERPVYED